LILEQGGLQDPVEQAQDVPLFLQERFVRCNTSVCVSFGVDMLSIALRLMAATCVALAR
jgi:hypothetical protein